MSKYCGSGGGGGDGGDTVDEQTRKGGEDKAREKKARAMNE